MILDESNETTLHYDERYNVPFNDNCELQVLTYTDRIEITLFDYERGVVLADLTVPHQREIDWSGS
jgi:hypothetical protein